MEPSVSRSQMIPIIGLALLSLILPASAQVTSACSASMLTSFTPCMNYLTNSSGSGTSPTSDCCNALEGLTNTSMDCACLIVTGGVPFQVPTNRTLAISLPKACNMAGVPVQCKASVAPSVAPTASPSVSPSAAVAPEPTSSAEAPESDTNLTPPSSTTDGGSAPTSSVGIRPVLTPSAASSSYYSISSSLVLLALGVLAIQSY